MKAIVLDGVGIDSLTETDLDEPEPGPGEVKLRMRAASLNHRDVRIVEGRDLYPETMPRPLVPVSDGVGEVVEVGNEVETLRVGDRVAPIIFQTWLSGNRTDGMAKQVLGGPRHGVLREYAVFPESGVVVVPDHLADEEAAALPCAAVTAWQALVRCGGVRAGDAVLVQGTGGVSLFAVQFAALSGARPIVVSRSKAKLDEVRRLGNVELIHSRDRARWVSQVLELTNGEGVDHLIEVIGDLANAVSVMRTGGTISQVGYLARGRLTTDAMPFLQRNLVLRGISVGPRATFDEMNRAIALHKLKPMIDRIYPVDGLRDALTRIKTGRHFGKVTIKHW